MDKCEQKSSIDDVLKNWLRFGGWWSELASHQYSTDIWWSVLTTTAILFRLVVGSLSWKPFGWGCGFRIMIWVCTHYLIFRLMCSNVYVCVYVYVSTDIHIRTYVFAHLFLIHFISFWFEDGFWVHLAHHTGRGNSKTPITTTPTHARIHAINLMQIRTYRHIYYLQIDVVNK